MDTATLTSLRDLGIAIVAVLAFAYITKYVIDSFGKLIASLTEQLKSNRLDYTNFVESNNHGNTERIEKSTEAMVKVSEAIDRHTAILDKLLDKIQK